MKYTMLLVFMVNTFAYSSTNIVVSILPQKIFVEKIGGNKVNVIAMVKPGNSPHTYEPKPSQMKAISNADIYFPIGIEFEKAWLDKFKNQNKKMKILETTTGINYLEMEKHSHHHESDKANSTTPFEWAGLFSLKKGIYTWSFSKVDSAYAEKSIKMLILETNKGTNEGIENIEATATSIYREKRSLLVKDLDLLYSNKGLYDIEFDEKKDITTVKISIPKDANYVFFTEHLPFEFEKNEHFFKDSYKNDVEMITSEPNTNDNHNKNKDPHVWTSPSNVKIIAKNIYNDLSKVDPKNREYFKKNYFLFIKEINDTDIKIKKILSNLNKGSKFMAFHPSWGYFAQEYSLIQLVIEVEGKEPKLRILQNIIKEAIKEKVKTIFTQPEFSDKSAKTIANQLNISVVKITPLSEDWSNNLIKMAESIAD